ncbi:MAG: hypothetical protein WC657_05710 [Candidatus Paceibacterota bacterium]|jgi:hypothetical protein
MDNRLRAIALATILEEAEAKASKAALDLIKATAPWDICDPHGAYYKAESEILMPYINWAVLRWAGHLETDQYLEGLITGREYLSAMLLKIA